MAERNLGDTPDILESDLFTNGTGFLLNVSGRFRDIATTLVRNAISKAFIRSEDRAPGEADLVTGLSQIWFDTDGNTQHLSIAGGAWSQVANTVEDGEDGWSPVFSAVSDTARRVLRLTDWIGGSGTKPAIGKYVGPTGLVTDITDAVDIRGAPGTPGQADDGDDGDDGWSPEFAIESSGSKRVVKVVDWAGGGGTKPAINRYVGASGFVTAIADAVDVRGPAGTPADGGLSSVAIDDTLKGDGTPSSVLGVAGGWKTAARAPVNGDKVTGATVVFYDSSRKETHVSIVGSDWILITSANAVMKATSLGDFNISSDTSTSPLGDIVISSNYVAFSTTDRDGSAVGSLLNDIDVGNVIIVYVGGVWKNTLRVTSIDTTNDIYMGTWEKTYRASDFPAVGIATADHIAPDKLIESNSVGSRELKDKGVIAAKFGKNAVETGKTVLLGEWTEGTIGLNRGNFQTRQQSSSRQIEIEKVDSVDNSFDPNEAEIEDLEAGDLLYLLADSGSTGINALLVSEPPSSETDSYRIKGTWQEHYQAISTGTSVAIYKVKSNNILAKGVPSTSKFIGAEADGKPVWKTSGQQGEGATADDIQSGVYSELTTRTIIDSGSPARGQMAMTSTALQIHYEAADATVNSDALEGIAVGDRIQVSDVNVFVVTHVPSGSPTVFTFSGTWAETFDADAFQTSVTLYHIKKMNVLIHNVAVPGRYVKIGASRLLEAEAADDRHADTLWAAPNGGVITSSSTTTYTLEAGKKFSDYRDIYVIHDARASNFPPTANQKMSAMVLPSSQFKAGYMPRIQIDGNWKDLFIVSDTQFRIQAASSETVMHIRSLLGAK